MGSLFIVLLASFCAACSSYCIRKNGEYFPNAKGYLFIHYLVGFVFSFLASLEILSLQWSPIILFIGSVTGLFHVLLMRTISRAILRGPSGLTFAFLNSGSIFPAFILYCLFGNEFGFDINYQQITGMLLVVLGLFLASKNQSRGSVKVTKDWIKYTVACFLLQILILTVFKWRCLFTCEGSHLLLPQGITQDDDLWFMPGFFGMATIAQFVLFAKDRRKLYFEESVLGFFGGIANAGSTFLLLIAAQWAVTPMENGILFPLFAITTILLCNLWGKKLYKEEFNLLANSLCCMGVLIGSL